MQLLCEVAVGAGIPTDDALTIVAVNFVELLHRTTGVRSISGPSRERQAEQAINLPAPRFQLACGMRVRINGDGLSSNTLQPNWLPHQQVFLVGAGADDDQIARDGVVDRSLQGVGL